MELDVINLKVQIKERLTYDRRIELVYLFGSLAKDIATPLSDADIAILLSKEISASDYLKVQLGLVSAFEPFFPKIEVQLVVLNGAPIVLSYEVIQHGKCLFARSENLRIEYETGTMREFFDTEYMRYVQDYYQQKRIMEGRFGRKFKKHKRAA
ncbi:MAG: nucleotidyltransferase domain-containing protein [Nitrospirota bacterium]